MKQKPREFKNVANICRIARVNTYPQPSQSDVSIQLGYRNGQFISNVERAKCSLPAEKIMDFAKLTRIDPHLVVDAMVKDYRDYLLAQVHNPVVTSSGGDSL